MKIEYEEGVVVDVNDPEGKARVKVRLYKYHTQMDDSTGETYGLSDDDLDWSPVMMPTTSSSRGGVGASPSGLTVNDRVSCLVLDTEYVQSFIVIGTIHGDGDISNISWGGIEALESDSVRNTNNSLAVAPNLNSQEYDQEGMENDDVGYQTFMNSLVMEEGFVDHTYYDQFRYPHIGIGTLLIQQSGYSLDKAWSIVERKLGRKIPNKRITRSDADRLVREYISGIKRDINKYPLLSTAYNSCSSTRQYALLSMCYQLGTAGVAKFTGSLNAIISEDWRQAYSNLTNSKWARQTPSRAKRVASVIRDNNFNSYPMSVRGGSSRQMMRSGGGNNVGSENGINDISIVQTQLIESTKALRSFGQINTIEDVKNFLDIILNFDGFLNGLASTISSIKGLIKTIRDIDAIDFINRYLEQFKAVVEQFYERIKEFVVYTANQVVEGFEELINMVELVIKQIFHNIMAIGVDIGDAIDNVYNSLHEEAPEEEENGVLFSEPPSEYAGLYPYVKTEISESGILREVDDTPGFERLKEMHPSGTYREINSNGRSTEKVASDRYIIIKNDDHLFIEGSGKITIGGNHIINIIGDSIQVINGDVRQVIRGNSEMDIAGDSEIIVHGNTDLNVKGNTNALIEGNVTSEIKGNYYGKIIGDTQLDIEGKTTATLMSETKIMCKSTLDATVESDATVTVYGNMKSTVDGNWEADVGGNMRFTADGTIGLYGSKIYLDRS